MKKIIARYLYSPICTESYATLDRLKRLFYTLEDQVHFECINTADTISDHLYAWFLTEKELIDTIEGKGIKPLTYNKLFIEGKEIRGFPPSKEMIEKELKNYNIHFPEGAYKTYYKQSQKNIWEIDEAKIKIRKYKKEALIDVCLICTKHNPFLEESDYLKENWGNHEVAKKNYIEKILHEDKMLGFIAYYEEQPVGFIEAFPLKIAAKLGFPISDIDFNGVMITCLNIRAEATGNGIASRLIKEISEESKIKNYKSIEVLAYPDNYNWQPISIYKKYGFIDVKNIEDLHLMRKLF